MTDFNKVINAIGVKDQICEYCNCMTFFITETQTTTGVFVSSIENDFKDISSVFNYEIKCCSCNRIAMRETVVKPAWKKDWDAIGDILDKRRQLRIKADGKKLQGN